MSEQEVKELDLNGEMLVRREKLAALRKKGNAFPNQFRRDALAQDLHDKYEAEDGEVLKEKAIEVAVAGRIMTRRAMGKATFITLQDMSGKSNYMLLVITFLKAFMLKMSVTGI